MARARRKRGVQVDAGEGKPIVRAMPDVCPVCGVSPADKDMKTHLQSHAPGKACPPCGEKHVGWKVDWDTIAYPREGLFFYCDPCGKYAPVEASPEH
jgi:hypothetical protein